MMDDHTRQTRLYIPQTPPGTPPPENRKKPSKLSFGVVCSSNINRSMEAHLVLGNAGLTVEAMGQERQSDCQAKVPWNLGSSNSVLPMLKCMNRYLPHQKMKPTFYGMVCFNCVDVELLSRFGKHVVPCFHLTCRNHLQHLTLTN